ncbi:MAG: DUF501 domain-containing protein [Actinobacteria bacterium]|nr:DUF501 domain-containing protein [Actinomycetota bacterium]
MVVARCAEGHPLVIRNATRDADGTPFPTRYWLTCPAAAKAVSTLESNGAIADLNLLIEGEPGYGLLVDLAHQAYAAEREEIEPGSGSWGGVAGTARGIKCLHAHYAYWLAGGNDPVGEWTATNLTAYHSTGLPPVAAVDLGTNSIRLLVAVKDYSTGTLRDLARDMVITRIGKDVDETGRLSEEGLSRTVEVLRGYVNRARALGARRISVAATSAVRDAANQGALGMQVKALTDSDLRILSGEEEAATSFLGAVRTLPDAEGPYLVMDIGGGSTEFVLGTDGPAASISTDMGSVRLTERHVRSDPPTADELAATATDADSFLDDVEAAVPVRDARTMIAVAGTATTMAGMALELPEYDPDRIHGTELTLQQARAVRDRLAAMTNPQRAAIPVMPPGREDVIVVGATILVRAMERFGFDRATVSEHDILDGLAMQMLESPLT